MVVVVAVVVVVLDGGRYGRDEADGEHVDAGLGQSPHHRLPPPPPPVPPPLGRSVMVIAVVEVVVVVVEVVVMVVVMKMVEQMESTWIKTSPSPYTITTFSFESRLPLHLSVGQW